MNEASVVVGMKRNPSFPKFGSAGGYRTGADFHHPTCKVEDHGPYLGSTSHGCCTNDMTGEHTVGCAAKRTTKKDALAWNVEVSAPGPIPKENRFDACNLKAGDAACHSGDHGTNAMTHDFRVCLDDAWCEHSSEASLISLDKKPDAAAPVAVYIDPSLSDTLESAKEYSAAHDAKGRSNLVRADDCSRATLA